MFSFSDFSDFLIDCAVYAVAGPIGGTIINAIRDPEKELINQLTNKSFEGVNRSIARSAFRSAGVAGAIAGVTVARLAERELVKSIIGHVKGELGLNQPTLPGPRPYVSRTDELYAKTRARARFMAALAAYELNRRFKYYETQAALYTKMDTMFANYEQFCREQQPTLGWEVVTYEEFNEKLGYALSHGGYPENSRVLEEAYQLYARAKQGLIDDGFGWSFEGNNVLIDPDFLDKCATLMAGVQAAAAQSMIKIRS